MSLIEKQHQDRDRQLAAKSAEAPDDAEIPDFREPTPPPIVRPSGLPNRARQLPKHYWDILPPLPILPQPSQAPAADSPPQSLPTGSPSHSPTPPHPDEITSLAHLSDSTHFTNAQQPAVGLRPWWSGFGTSMKTQTEDFFVPFLSATTYRLMCWFHGGSTMKSLAELDRLVNEVILADDFDKVDLQGFRASRELEHLDNYQGDPEDIRSLFSTADGWIETSIKICLPPADGVKHPSEESAPEFAVPGLFYHRPLEVLKTAFHEASAEQFHLTPFETSFQPSPNEPVEH
ncbi:hypothetical protein BDR05DRAFT_1003193 [Suillus weaverae]|nr:hypothetical protein BDR05DRAFT_1003193 [Suillus weaverae]